MRTSENSIQGEIRRIRPRLLFALLVAVLVYGCLSWLNGGEPIGNAGAWLMVVLAISWPAALSSGGCASRLWKRHHS